MNPTKIEWADYVWNPTTGCHHGCEYCYARLVAHQKVNHPDPKIKHKYRNDFEPTFHPEEFAQDKAPSSVKGGRRVFVGSMTDLFGEWVLDEWIEQVFAACEAAPQHTYYFLTKNPGRYHKLTLLDNDDMPQMEDHYNWHFGFSATNGDEYIERNGNMSCMLIRDFASLEPLRGPIKLGRFCPRWIIVGAETRNGIPVNMPRREWILDIRKQCKDLNIPLFEKNSLAPLDLPGGLIQEWPTKELEADDD